VRKIGQVSAPVPSNAADGTDNDVSLFFVLSLLCFSLI
jgi:hypothetical protein